MGHVYNGPTAGICPCICIPPTQTEGEGKNQKKPGAKIFVLHIEDRPFLLDVVKWSLESGGEMVVDSAQSITDAIQKIGTCRCDVVVTDYRRMGETTGTALFQLKRESGISKPFIFFTLEEPLFLRDDKSEHPGDMQYVREHTLSGMGELKRLIHAVLKCPGSCYKARESHKSRGYPP